MKVLLSWLREFAPFEQSPDVLGDALSDLGTPVEAMERVGEGLDGIVVARVLDLRRHPNADKIQLVDVDAGDGEALQVCCGAFNMAVGDLVPLATLGTTMPGGMAIERRKLRGEWSNGMLCSGRELGLGADHEGILVLAPGVAEPGTPLAEALGLAPRRALRPRGQPQPPRRHVDRGRGPRPGGPPGPPLHPRVAERSGRCRDPGSRRPSVEVVDADLCGRFAPRVLET